jgi:hypothetical protein
MNFEAGYYVYFGEKSISISFLNNFQLAPLEKAKLYEFTTLKNIFSKNLAVSRQMQLVTQPMD